jgi:type IV secretory pathway TrbD component
MLNPYILQRVSQPTLRMGVNQFSLPISLLGLMISVIFNYYLFGVSYFVISHSLLIWMTHKNPYFMEVFFAKMRFYKQAKSQLISGHRQLGINIYEY